MRNLNWPVVIAKYKELMKNPDKYVVFYNENNEYSRLPGDRGDEVAGYVGGDKIYIKRQANSNIAQTIQHEIAHIALHSDNTPLIPSDGNHAKWMIRIGHLMNGENEADILTYKVYGFPDAQWKLNHINTEMNHYMREAGISSPEFLAIWDEIVAHKDFPAEWRNAYLKKYRNVPTHQPKMIQHKSVPLSSKYNVEQRVIAR